MKITFRFINPQARKAAKDCIDSVPDDYECDIRPRKRTLPQNSIMWGMLGDVSGQVDWYGMKLTSDEWKDVFTAALKGQKTVPGIEGGFVVLGAHTSKMNVKEMADLITLMSAFGAEKGVKFKAYGDE